MTTSAFALTGTTSYVDEFSNAVAPAISADDGSKAML